MLFPSSTSQNTVSLLSEKPGSSDVAVFIFTTSIILSWLLDTSLGDIYLGVDPTKSTLLWQSSQEEPALLDVSFFKDGICEAHALVGHVQQSG